MEPESTRALEESVQRDFTQAMSYGDYLRLDLVLSAQQPLSNPPRHDELLFIIQHQTSELWLKLMLHELRAVRDLLRDDQLAPALKSLARVKHIQHTLIEQWGVLTTLTPSEYNEFRSFLQSSSGFQSWQYRAIEFILGNKNADMLQVFDHDPSTHRLLSDLMEEPTVYDEFLRFRHPRTRPDDGLAPPPCARARLRPHLRELPRVLAGVRGMRGPGRRGGQLPAVALPTPQDGRAHHRLEERHRRIERGALPPPSARPHVLPRAVRRARRT